MLLKNNDLRRLSLEDCNKIYALYGRAYNISQFLVWPVTFLFPRLRMLKRVFNSKVEQIYRRIS